METSLSDPDVRVGVFFTHLCPQEFSSCRQSPTCDVIRMLFILLDVALVGFTTNLSWVVSVMLVIRRSYALCPTSYLLNCSSWKNIVKTFVSCSVINCLHLYKKIQPRQKTCIQVVYQNSQFLMSMFFKSQFFCRCRTAPDYKALRPTFETNEEAWLSQLREMQHAWPDARGCSSTFIIKNKCGWIFLLH